MPYAKENSSVVLSASQTAVNSSQTTQLLTGLPVPQRYWAIATIALGIMLAVLDATMIAVALPSIAQSLNVSAAESVWILNAYQLVIVIGLLPLASLGDILGYRKIYCTGLLLFILGSLSCALSDSLLSLIYARSLQGLGAACIMSVGAALVRFIYPPHLLGRGIGFNAMIVAVSASIGPTVSAAVLFIAPWPWLFAINIPIGLMAFIIGRQVLPRIPGSGAPFDTGSALLHALTFGLLIYGIRQIAEGESLSRLALYLSASLLFGYALVRRQALRPAPLLPVDLLKIPIFALSIATSVCSFAAQMMALLSFPFFLQTTLHYSPAEVGLVLTAWPLSVAVMAPLAGRLVERFQAGLLGGIGLGLLALGLLLLALLPDQPSKLDIAWRLALSGIGFGLFQTPNNRTIITSAPPKRSGGASGMLSTGRLLGQTLGAAFVALIFSMQPGNYVDITLEIAAGFAAVAAVLSSLRLKAQVP